VEFRLARPNRFLVLFFFFPFWLFFSILVF
jgi:hypothetical protein